MIFLSEQQKSSLFSGEKPCHTWPVMIKANRKTGGQILVNSLSVQGVRRLFCVAGESYLPVLDALLEHEEIEAITCRHESCAGFMGEAYGKLTGKPGIDRFRHTRPRRL